MLSVRLPAELVQRIEEESRERQISRSEVVRERLESYGPARAPLSARLEAINDLIGAVDHLAPGVSANRKAQLKATGYGRKRPR
jgi:metal-responsive CopG/Arc/MetJ family transcriptional regulator